MMMRRVVMRRAMMRRAVMRIATRIAVMRMMGTKKMVISMRKRKTRKMTIKARKRKKTRTRMSKRTRTSWALTLPILPTPEMKNSAHVSAVSKVLRSAHSTRAISQITLTSARNATTAGEVAIQ